MYFVNEIGKRREHYVWLEWSSHNALILGSHNVISKRFMKDRFLLSLLYIK